MKDVVNNPTIVTVQDCKDLGWCNAGIRQYADIVGISWQEFIDNGIPLSKLVGIDDVNVKRIVEYVNGKKEDR